ncbi:ABC transporter ATP-binding protein [Paludibacterium sp.]|uniref:ABC transporter ATP-binding protein n=1 Tax=Paludibacterium sp. TaxID=1917523 RepID=UPI0025FDF693|nr:ABC transporter ATP-binding protein [Paludibacterium sp.]
MTAIDIHQLSKHYGAMPAVDDVTLSIAAGSRMAVVGPSGSGKTTLLRLIAGFEFPDAGRIALDGQLLADAHRAVPAHERGIGYVPQDGALFPHLSVADNIGFGLSETRHAKRARIDALLTMVSLDPVLGTRWPHELSGGQQQRVALARALAQRPRLMLLDEPFSALDTGLRVSMRKAVAQLLRETGITAILVTHDQAEALSFADQLAVMRQGRLVQHGTPAELYRHPRDGATALFLGEAVILPARLHNGRAHCALGDLPAPGQAVAGTARIMLRPEQLRLLPAGDGADCQGRVADIDFGGHSSLLDIVLPARDGEEPVTLQVKYAGLALPALGSMVRVAVDGHAHVLGD